MNRTSTPRSLRTTVADFARLVPSTIYDRARDRLERVRLQALYIRGVEVTQAIQWFQADQHLTDPADRGPDNGVRLVAGKPAWVRIYVGSLLGDVSDVSATVRIAGHRRGQWHDLGALTPQITSTVTARRTVDYARDRASIWRTLNFAIPAELMSGRRKLVVTVQAPGSRSHRDEVEVELDVRLRQTLQIRGIPIRYWDTDAAGNPIRLGPSTLADFTNTARWTLLTWPVQATPSISLAGILTWSMPLNDAAVTTGGCSTNWNDLLVWLRIAKAIDGNRPNVIYYGMLPTGMPTGAVVGCGNTNDTGAGVAGDGITMAHEMGHFLGFPHAPCGNVGTAEAGYPAYEPYDSPANRMASIGEYGLDVTNGAVYSPATARDFMSYCPTRWISLHRYLQLIGNDFLAPRLEREPRWPPDIAEGPVEFWPPEHLPDPPPPWVDGRWERVVVPERVLVLTGVLDHGEIDVRSVWRVEAHRPEERQVVPGAMVELLDASERVLSRAPLGFSAARGGCDCGCGHVDEPRSLGVVQAFVPDPGGEVARIRVVEDGNEIFSRGAPSSSPSPIAVEATIDGDDVVVHHGWADEPEQPPDIAVRWSSDEGRSWQLLGLVPPGDEAVFPVAMLTVGEALVQVLASDGFHTTTAEPAAVTVPPRDPVVTILWPDRRGAARAGHPMRLWGTATAGDGRVLEGEALRWAIDGHEVGNGADMWIDAPGEGDHRVTLTGIDGDRRGSTSIVFAVTCSGQPPHRVVD